MQVIRDTEMKARIQGVNLQRKRLQLFFGFTLGLMGISNCVELLVASVG